MAIAAKYRREDLLTVDKDNSVVYSKEGDIILN